MMQSPLSPDVLKDVNVYSLAAIARDRAENAATASDKAKWAAVLDAIAVVGTAELDIREWAACLRCPLAFPTAVEHSRHYWAAHR